MADKKIRLANNKWDVTKNKRKERKKEQQFILKKLNTNSR